MLTEEQKLRNEIQAAWGIIDSERAGAKRMKEEIERLKSRCAELEKDAGRRLDLVKRVREFPENVIYKGSLLWGDILRELDSAMSGQEKA